MLGILLASASNAHADLLGFWSANDGPNDNFSVKNDFGNADYEAIFEGDATWTDDGAGVSGAAGDYAMEFFGTDEDFAQVDIPGITYEEITITAWIKGNQTGPWSGLFGTRDGATPVGMGYNGDSGRLTYTWNDNSGDTWDFPANSPDGDDLLINPDEWSFVAVSLEPTAATLYVGEKGGDLFAVANEIPQLVQTPDGTGWRMGEDNCCGAERNFEGLMDNVSIWDHRLTAAEIGQLHSMEKSPADFTERLGGLRQVQVAGATAGTESLAGSLSDVVIGDPKPTDGLAQYWFEGNLRGNVEFFVDNGETGTAENPLLTAGPFASSTTWWAGPQNQNIISDQALPSYPAGLAGTRFEGSNGQDNYAVRLTGEIFVTKDGEFLLRDGIDDFTMVAIDQDGNGELDELADIVSSDVGQLFPGDPIGDVLILDDSWSNLDGSNQQEDFHGIANFENVDAAGEWRKIEMWMSEGGGGDAGILYGGYLDEEGIFDETVGGALTQEEIDAFVIRNDQLRSTVAGVESASASAALATNVEYVFQIGAEGSDEFAVDDADGLYNTTLDVAGATVRVQTEGELADGTTVTLFNADKIAGLDSLNLLFDDASQWDLSNLASGQITFGTAAPLCEVNTQGDLNGDGNVGFPDFLLLSANFGSDVSSHTEGDVNCDGSVGFPDFLVLSANFGKTVGASAASVPEPSGFALFSIAGLLVGMVRRRR